ncbi:LacI family DNA-binding transcriptional regulator [soil metagenome]
MASTIRDVAREAGVSVATVSRVFNNSGPVHEDTRRRIDDVAKRLRYIPNGAARTLSTRRTQTIGVVLPDLYGEFFSEVIRGIDQEVQRSGWHLLVSSSHNDRAEIEAALRAMRGRVDGLIVMSPDPDTHVLAQNLPEKLPVVLLNCAGGDGIYNSLNMDNRGGAFAVTEHLLKQGHRRIGLITGPMRNHDARERLRGAHEALAAAGATAAPELEVAGDFSEQSGHRAALELVELESRPTALFAANDSMAIGALSALREAGVRVPDEMAVAGFDDIPIARYVSPPLTTVRVSIPELGGQAARRLFEAITDPNGERRQDMVPTELVVRRSCGAPRGSGQAAGAPSGRQ